jgi:8-oxo-dGTP diphosphatase
MVPQVGVSVLLYNGSKILLGKRLGKHGHGYYGLPGGHLEGGESFETCAIRETEEETGIRLTYAKYFTARNTIFYSENKHYVVVFMKARYPMNHPICACEPLKCAEWGWYDVKSLPGPLLPGLQMLVDEDLL